MFDIGWGELVVIGIVALIAIGPKELPTVLRTIGQYMGKVRRMASEFQGQFQDAMREAEMADLKKHADDLNSTVSDLGNFDPLASAQKDLNSAFEDKPQAPTTESPTGEPAASEAATGEQATAQIASAETAAAQTGVAPSAPEISVPLPEPAPAVTETDFATAEPQAKKQSAG
ncbi:MAG: Sec-independent protein translocase protein TatB [Pseudolabrys sp.]|jgi:sec-independent protein translocase protein TatB